LDLYNCEKRKAMYSVKDNFSSFTRSRYVRKKVALRGTINDIYKKNGDKNFIKSIFSMPCLNGKTLIK